MARIKILVGKSARVLSLPAYEEVAQVLSFENSRLGLIEPSIIMGTAFFFCASRLDAARA